MHLDLTNTSGAERDLEIVPGIRHTLPDRGTERRRARPFARGIFMRRP